MDTLYKIMGFGAALVFIGVSLAISGVTGWNQTSVEWQQYLYLALACAAVIWASFAIMFIDKARRNKQWVVFLAGGLLLVGAEVYTMRMELRFFTLSQSDGIELRKDQGDSRKSIKAKITVKEKRLSWVPPHRELAIVSADLNAHKAKYSKRPVIYCNSKARWAKNVCSARSKLNVELASANSAVKLEQEIKDLQAQKRQAPIVAEAMPEAAWLSRHLPIDEEGAIDWLMISGLLFLALGRTFGIPIAMAGKNDDPPIVQAAIPVVEEEYPDDEPANDNVVIFDEVVKNLSQNDHVMHFVADLMIARPGIYTFDDLHKKLYQQHCEANGIEPLTWYKFSQRMLAMDLDNYIEKNKRHYIFEPVQTSIAA